MKTLRSCLLAVFLAPLLSAAPADSAPRERISFNSGWRFIKDDPRAVGEALTYERIKEWILPTGDELLNDPPRRMPRPPGEPGGDVSYTRANFADTAWRSFDLPHDWGIEGPFQQALSGETGKLPWFGVAWYRKKFTAPAEDAGRNVYLEIDGAMAYATVWLNGHCVGGWPYGYSSWRVDLTPHLKVGAENTLAIRLDNPRESSRWYPGGGIYRNVWLLKTAPVQVAQWGVFVTTPLVSRESASVDVGITLDNKSAARAEVKVNVALYAADATGQAIGDAVVTGEPRAVRVEPGRQANVSHTLAVASPKLWSLQERNRYVAETTIIQGEKILDRVLTPFGIRTIAHTLNDGFLLNGERIQLYGVCNHHDLGALGAAINVRALERQLEILREMGGNAIRTSHNPPAPELLELCDRMGFLVMVEAFDCWAIGKIRDDYSRVYGDWHQKDLRAMVRRDRNHPSVIQWSIGNEIREQWESDGWKVAAHLAAIVREEDLTRPVVAGFNNIQSGFNGFQRAVDIVGYNYKPTEYAPLRKRHPHVMMMGAETASTLSTRGEYFFPVVEDKLQGRADFQMSSYDLYAARWAHIPDVEWRGLDENPYVHGEFVWTGFDYLGEPTPYSTDSTILLNYSSAADRAKAEKELQEVGKITVPSRSSYFGIIDLAGFPKDRFYLYQARWRPELPMVHILPHWNWPDRAGEVTPVFAYSSADEAELFLNGQSQGRRKRGALEYRFRWNDVKYAPGEIKVVAYKNGKVWAESARRTTGVPAKMILSADRATLRADGHDLSFITVKIADERGDTVPRAKNALAFELTGPGEILATDNGDPTSFESFQGKERKAFNGLALVIVRTKSAQPGALTLKATGEGLAPAQIELRSE